MFDTTCYNKKIPRVFIKEINQIIVIFLSLSEILPVLKDRFRSGFGRKCNFYSIFTELV